MLDARRLLVSVMIVGACKSGADTSASKAASAPTEATAHARPQRTAPARTPQQLIAALEAFKAKVTGATPSPDQDSFVDPPTEAELAWINDRSIPMADRISTGMSLYERTRVIMTSYAEYDVKKATIDPAHAKDSVASLLWSEATIREFGRVSTLMVDEFRPTLSKSDPSYEVRMGGLAKMGEGASYMLQGTMITIKARASDLDARQRIAGAWRDHIAAYSKLWTQAQCDELAKTVGNAAASETDPSIATSLGVVQHQLKECRS